MSVRIKTDMLVSALGYTAQFNMSSALYGGGGQTKINHASTKHFDPFLKSVYDEVRKQNGGKEVTPSELSKAFEAKGAALIQQAAGVGRSATYVSEKEVEQLPPSLQKMFHDLKARRQRAADERAALFEPFPRGVAKPELFFSRYLGHIEAKTAAEMLGDTKLEVALPALAKAAKKAPLQLGELTVYGGNGDKPIKVDGRSFYNGNGGDKLAIKKGDELVLIGWTDGFGDAEVAKISMNRFSLKSNHGDALNGTGYNVPGTSMEDLLAKLTKLSPNTPALPKKSEEDQLLDRWPSVDLDGLKTVLRAIATHAGDASAADASDKIADAAQKKIDAALPKFADKAKLLERYADLAARAQKAGGELVLGDMDTYVRVADKFSKTYEDENGKEKESVLVEGKGPLLIVDNHFGGLGHAIPLAALEEKKLEIYVSHEDQARGRLEVDAKGKVVAAPDAVMLNRVANDLLQFLPAQLADS